IETVFAETLQPLQLSVSVSMDHGVANFPQDGEQADQLIRIADERLYRLKHANHSSRAADAAARTAFSAQQEASVASSAPAERPAAPSRPIPIESKRPQEKAEPAPQAVASVAAGGALPQATSTFVPRTYTVQRKAERVSMSGTNAYAVLGDQGVRRARVVDLGFGGVAIELDTAEEISESVLAVLHVPILPPVRVNLKPVWSQRTPQGGFRIGCAFVS
ncbi:MAG: hypothetical protein ACRD36_06700, partial [Candidatus Acidiferrum sp.]